MSTQTTYRLRWPSRGDEVACANALAPCATLPLYDARPFDDPMFEVGNVAPGITVRHLVPDGHPGGETFWSWDDGVFTFAADLLNPSRAGHASSPAESEEASRETVLLDALGRTCAAPAGSIVGAFFSEGLGEWFPMVWVDGRLLRGYVNSWSPERLGATFREHNGLLSVDLLEIDLDDGSLTIPFETF
ncbi:hypothetical protein [Sphingomonas sp. 3-13AW]|uniref:hypothetical protein n=1 Tax=Sphingomonas sp. 3-13AW TaxID=3050450 RepID=UPI003BB6B9A2